MLKNPVKATKYYYDIHDCKSHGKCVLDGDWLAMQKVSKESLDGLFQHICPVYDYSLCNIKVKKG